VWARRVDRRECNHGLGWNWKCIEEVKSRGRRKQRKRFGSIIQM
jgi:hypothetical protein